MIYIDNLGFYHREDGPALQGKYGAKYWYHHGNLHRLDGPAIEFSNGDKEWWIDGYKINCSSQEKFKRIIKLKAFW